MKIDYQRIDKELNTFAIDVIYEILDKYSNFISKQEKDNLVEKITHNRAIIVDEPSKEDEDFFQGNIPVAHGPRAKGDRYIHIYPYAFHNKNTEEIITNCIDHIIIHELYHFIIKLDIDGEYTKDEIDFGHYLTEGMVQLFSEIHQGKIDRTSKYRKNVDNAKIIYETFPNNPSPIFQHNYKELFMSSPNLSTIFEDFLKEKEFTNKLDDFFKERAPIINWEQKRLISKSKSFSIDDTLINLKNLIEKHLTKEEAKSYCNKLDEIYTACFKQNKKSII
ncbi:MAG: hypothetical protein K2I70_01765 [Bacilli bacterium]|nr:hypothetical protein [Bacilli bacterium]